MMDMISVTRTSGRGAQASRSKSVFYGNRRSVPNCISKYVEYTGMYIIICSERQGKAKSFCYSTWWTAILLSIYICMKQKVISHKSNVGVQYVHNVLSFCFQGFLPYTTLYIPDIFRTKKYHDTGLGHLTLASAAMFRLGMPIILLTRHCLAHNSCLIPAPVCTPSAPYDCIGLATQSPE